MSKWEFLCSNRWIDPFICHLPAPSRSSWRNRIFFSKKLCTTVYHWPEILLLNFAHSCIVIQTHCTDTHIRIPQSYLSVDTRVSVLTPRLFHFLKDGVLYISACHILIRRRCSLSAGTSASMRIPCLLSPLICLSVVYKLLLHFPSVWLTFWASLDKVKRLSFFVL